MNTEQVNPRTIAEAYLAIWNEPDQEQRLNSLQEGWATNARYTDPLMKGETSEGISKMIEAARAQFPGHRFILRGSPDGHGHAVRFSWDLIADGGSKVAAGTDIVRLDNQGKLAEVIGFLD